MTSPDVNFLDLDLNLLIALDVLLTERSVTRAAEALHRSQPALSASLKRLRHQFNDDLLIRVGNRYELTPLALQLKPRVALILADLERLFGTRARFDAENSTREFVVGTADYGQLMLGRAIATEIAIEAPNVRLRFRPLSDAEVSDPGDSLRSCDGFILPHGFIEGMPHVNAYVDRWVLLVDRRNTSLGETVELAELGGLDWVLAFHRQASLVPAVRQLQLLGLDLHVVIAVEGFLSLPGLVSGTNRITVIQERLAQRIAPASDFRIVECPFEAVPLSEALWWHPAVEHDPGHAWFRTIVERAGRRIADDGARRRGLGEE
jgi:DNA-binding transcriptional LysR family regulator